MLAALRTEPVETQAIRELARRELRKREAGQSFRSWTARVAPAFQWFRHNEAIGGALQKVADGKIKRLIIEAPPRHGKSEQTSRLFSAYYLHRFPERFVGLASYAADLAYTLSRAARRNYIASGHPLQADAAAVKQWETGAGGGLWACGVGGPATGKGAHLLLIDDPIKNAQDATSEVIRARQKDWYDAVWTTRAEPDAAMVIIMTRWHEDDLVGWQLAEELEGDKSEGWHVVNLPAIAEAEKLSLPPTCTLEPDWRKPGEPLCAERYPLPRLRKIEAKFGGPSGYYWNALFQQRPRAPEGKMFKREWFPHVEAAPAEARRVRWWDLAATADDGDFTSGVLMAEAECVYYIEDVVRGQWSVGARDKIILQTAEIDAQRYGGAVEQCSAQDPGQAGKKAAQDFVRMLSRFITHTDIESGDKVVRAGPFCSQAEAGNVRMVRGPWNGPYLGTMIEFPGRVNDDADASANAFNRLAGGAAYAWWNRL